MGLLLLMGLLACAVIGFRARQLKWSHGFGILAITLLLVFVRFESLSKNMTVEGLPTEGIWQHFLSSWLIAAGLWGLSFLSAAWLGAQRRLRRKVR